MSGLRQVGRTFAVEPTLCRPARSIKMTRSSYEERACVCRCQTSGNSIRHKDDSGCFLLRGLFCPDVFFRGLDDFLNGILVEFAFSEGKVLIHFAVGPHHDRHFSIFGDFLVIFFFIVRNLFVVKEEVQMEETFGEDYLTYKGKVRRWF